MEAKTYQACVKITRKGYKNMTIKVIIIDENGNNRLALMKDCEEQCKSILMKSDNKNNRIAGMESDFITTSLLEIKNDLIIMTKK